MNLDQLVQVIADLIGSPAVVFDSALRVASFSVHDDNVDHARSTIILSHRGSSRARAAILEHRVDHTHDPVRIPPLDGRLERIVTALRYDGRITGYLSYVPDDGEIASGTRLQSALYELGAILASRQLDQQTSSEEERRLVAALLSRYSEERRSAAEELVETGQLPKSRSYTVLVVSLASTGDHHGTRSRLVIERMITGLARISSSRALGSVPVDGDADDDRDHDEAILVVPDGFDVERAKTLVSTQAFADIRIGVGGARGALADAHESHREARIALRSTHFDAARQSRLAEWRELGIDRILLQLPLAHLGPDDLPDPVRRLLDAPLGNELAHTLEAYLDNGADAQRTAISLHVHRSTFYYRLDRVRAVIGVDLSDGIVRRELHTALRIATLAGMR